MWHSHSYTHPHCRRRHRSIFLKLFFVLIGTMLLIHFFLATFLGLVFGNRSKIPIEKNVQGYTQYLISEIGIPPDIARAQKIADEYHIQIRYESQDMVWSSAEDMPTVAHVQEMQLKRSLLPSSASRKYYVLTNPDGSVYLFRWDIGHMYGFQPQILWGLLLLITIVFIGANYFIRRILRPIRWLHAGVHKLGEGDLNVQIPVYKSDELGRLTQAFNSMTKRIREMIKAREQLLLDVSHELRSPITRMKVALEMMPDTKRKKSITADIAEMEAMIAETLETERLKNGHGRLNLQKVDLVPLIREVSADFEKRSPGVRLAELPEKCILKIDVDRVKTVFKNVLENSIKFSQPDSNPIEVSLIEKGDFVAVHVKDDGTGIPQEDIPNLFEPFYRVDRSRSKKSGGYGLGLSLCKKIMDAHGGRIEISNNEKHGATVTLSFAKEKD